MNKILKEGIALVLGTSMMLTSVINISANVQDDTVDYVAFGDSIAYGYGLQDTEDCCINLVSEYLNTDVSNYAVNGLTSSGLITVLDSGIYDEDIYNADVITITIGSNDILHPFMEIVSNTVGIEGDFTTGMQQWYATSSQLEKMVVINQLNQVLQNNEVIETACENFKENTFPTIIEDIKDINPDCEIVVTNFYNPYYNVNIGGMLDLGSIADVYIQELNSALDTSSTDYTVANVYDDFNTTGLTNVNLDVFNLDAHPNIEGHKVIANNIIKNIKTKPATDIGSSIGNSIGSSNIMGDVNADGIVNTVDLLILKKYLLGLFNPSDDQTFYFDVNGSNSVNTADLLILKKINLGLL